MGRGKGKDARQIYIDPKEAFRGDIIAQKKKANSIIMSPEELVIFSLIIRIYKSKQSWRL